MRDHENPEIRDIVCTVERDQAGRTQAAFEDIEMIVYS